MGGSPTPADVALGEPSSVLLLAPSGSDFDEGACVDLMTADDVSGGNVLSVTLTQPPAERMTVWNRQTSEQSPARAIIVDASADHGETESATDPEDDLSSTFAVDVLRSNAEPVDIGMALARHLGAWESTPEQTRICLHSLTTLLDSFDRDAVVSLISALNDLCDATGATAHHHLDPAAHDDGVVATVRPLYDAVIEHVPEDGWTVTQAPDDAERPSFRRSTAPPGGTAGTDPSCPETIPMPYSFDQTLDLISVPRRRTLLYHLKDLGVGTVPIDELVDAVVTRERAIPARESPDSPESVRVSLVHAHLPKLADLGILELDAESAAIQYHGNPALESFLRYMETLELG